MPSVISSMLLLTIFLGLEESLAAEPQRADKLLEVLKSNENPAVSGQVGSIVSYGGKVTVIGNIYGGASFS